MKTLILIIIFFFLQIITIYLCNIVIDYFILLYWFFENFLDLDIEIFNELFYIYYISSTTLVVWGSNLTSNVNYPRFTKQVSNIIILPSYQKGVIVGLLLSDGGLSFSNSRSINARLGFNQSLDHFEYFWFVFTILSHYCSSYPYLTINIRNETQVYAIRIFTRSLPCFTELFTLFVINKVKVVPQDIFNQLTPVALAHWIIGDGAALPHGIMICTDSYSQKDVVKLINVLIIKYQLECTLRYNSPTRPRIYIKNKSMKILRSIILPYMHPSILYKIIPRDPCQSQFVNCVQGSRGNYKKD